jgi:hypothetical protein
MPLSKIDEAGLASGAQFIGFKNRIINGAMVIDQRNAGASVTGSGYAVDRFYNAFTSTNATQQRSTTVPQGFINSLLVTVTTATAPGTTSLAYVSQTIEGLNCADLDFGKATAATFTLSFWVRSSLTGTYAIGFLNGAQDRSYVATYSISAANTWEYKTITVAGDTSGTWLTNNGKGLCIFWDLGSGSNYQATAGSWQAGTLLRTSGSVNFANTLGATFFITGVQLEKGSTATSFDYRPYGTEEALCQRYYYRVSPDLFAPFGVGYNAGTTQAYINVQFPTVMRITPTAVEQTGTASNYRVRHSGGGTACSSVVSFVNGSPSNSFVIFTVASGLTLGHGAFGEPNLAGAYLGWSAEL